MQLRQIMQKEVVTVPPSATVFDTAIKMKDYKVGCVVVAEDGWNLKGIITDRDIALALTRESFNVKQTQAADIMTRNPKTVLADEDIDSAMRTMNKAKINRLPVLEKGKLVGIVSSADIATEMKDQLNQFFSIEEAFAKH